MTPGRLLRDARCRHGLTQAQLASLLGVQVFTISKWARGAIKRQAPGRMLELALAELDRQLLYDKERQT